MQSPDRFEALLRVQDLTRVFTSRRGLSTRHLVAVDRANLTVSADQHEIVTIAGESGQRQDNTSAHDPGPRRAVLRSPAVQGS